MASAAPPRSVQLRFIQKLQKELAGSTDVLEYAVSREWVTALQRFIEADEASGYTVPPVSASDWDDNNIYVGEKSWTVLVSWYGLENEYPFRRRATMAGYICISLPPDGKEAGKSTYVLSDNKMDFLTVHCCFLKDLGADVKQPYINIYFWESLDYIQFQVRCALKTHPEIVVRSWLSFSACEVDMVLENLHSYDQKGSSVGLVLCEKYLDVLDALQTRQTAVAPYLSQTVAGKVPVKEELSTLFAANDWKLTLCLEVLSPASSSKGQVSNSTTPAVPNAFRSLPLDNVFEAEAQNAESDWDAEMKNLLDSSVSEFNKLVVDQRNTIEARANQLLRTARENYLLKEQQVKAKMEEIDTQEKRLSEREKELNERDHELNSKLAKFKSMLTEFLCNKGKFEKEAAQLAEQNAITASKVELNVGGTRYTTSLQTLLKEEGSTLKLMFGGQHSLTADQDGSYFIDRDGTHFRHVLNFLRDGPDSLQHVPAHNVHLLSELRTEAEHYQLHRMAQALRARMSEGRAGADFVSLPS